MKDHFEVLYLKEVCDIQEKCINGEIDREECRQRVEIERLKYIAYLSERSRALQVSILSEKNQQAVLKAVKEGIDHAAD